MNTALSGFGTRLTKLVLETHFVLLFFIGISPSLRITTLCSRSIRNWPPWSKGSSTMKHDTLQNTLIVCRQWLLNILLFADNLIGGAFQPPPESGLSPSHNDWADKVIVNP